MGHRFGPSRANFADLVGSAGVGHNGWRSVYDAPSYPPMFSPHYEAYIWAVFLWAYSVSGYAPFLERSQNAISIMMANYPSKWIPTSNGIAMQR